MSELTGLIPPPVARAVLVFTACAVTIMSPVAAQRLEMRTGARAIFGELSPKLGVEIDSMRSVGRGVYVRDIQDGDGQAVGSGDLVSVHYVGMRLDGTRFAATDRTPLSILLDAGQVIPGWEEGLSGMRVGGRRQLLIPAFLAYGREGKGSIPPDTPLFFDVTLVGRK